MSAGGGHRAAGAARVAAAIVAGGRGRRLGGVDKTALAIAGVSVLERQLAVLRPRFAPLIVALAAEEGPAERAAAAGAFVVHDRPPAGRGPLAALEAVLRALAEPELRAAGAGDDVVCVGGDMPLLQPAALELLRDFSPGAAAVVPLVGGRPEPLFARYSTAALPTIAAALASGDLRTSAAVAAIPGLVWLPEDELRAADPGLLSLENVNTAADLARVAALAGHPPPR